MKAWKIIAGVLAVLALAAAAVYFIPKLLDGECCCLLCRAKKPPEAEAVHG